MISYELAKKLKDAEFPFKYINDPRTQIANTQFEDGTCAIFPTLSELIEACGEQFHTLARRRQIDNKLKWYASSFVDKYDVALVADSPEEAIANLWLTLHNK